MASIIPEGFRVLILFNRRYVQESGDMDLSGKKVCITGGNGVLGRAVAKKALSLGATVSLLDIAFDSDNVLDSSRVDQYVIDLSALDACTHVFDQIAPFDSLCNIAGGFAMGPTVYEVSQQDWDLMFTLNVSSAHNAIRAAIPHLVSQGRGSVVNVGALGALSGQPHMGAYTASKSVIMRLTEALSGELKGNGINVNAVLPGVIDTPRNRADMPDADPALWVAPEDLASAICFLASDAAKAVHGALLPVAGLS